MKKILVSIIIVLLSACFVSAQTELSIDKKQDSTIPAGDPRVREFRYSRYADPNDTYADSLRQADLRRNLPTNEEFFEKADLIAECKWGEFIGYYDAKGNYNPDDFYSVVEVLVLNVFKGDTTLIGKTISLVVRGGMISKPSVVEGELPEVIESRDLSSGMDHGLSISDMVSSVQFFMKSDYPEDPDKSKSYPHPKFKPLRHKEKACIFLRDGQIRGLNDLAFNSREELYQYMSQYKGVVVPDDELVRTPTSHDSTSFTPTKIELKDFDRATRKAVQKKWGEPKKKSASDPRNSNTLTLTIANQETTHVGSKSYFEFDLMASTNNPNIYFDGTPFKIEYNTADFGATVVSNNKMVVTIDNAFSNYMLYQCSDLSGVQNAFYIIFGAKMANPVRLSLSAVPKRLLHFRMELLPGISKNAVLPNINFRDTHTTCYSSTYTLTASAPFGNDELYSMTNYTKQANTNPPVITNFTPATINAGNGEVLTIRGSNFGDVQGKVRFSSADDGGASFLKDLDDEYYVSWTDTEIKVKVPSLVYKGYNFDPDKKYRGGAGTGKIQIETAAGDSCRSATVLTIPWSFINTGGGPSNPGTPIERPYLTKMGCQHDFTFTLDVSVQGNQPAITVIEAVLNKWSTLLNISIGLERDQNGNLVYEIRPERKVTPGYGKNYIYFSATSMPASDMMVAHNRFAQRDSKYYQATSSNIQIRPSNYWSYNMSGTTPSGRENFYNLFLHEVGHILLLQHVNSNSEVMYHKLSSNPIVNINANSACVQATANSITRSKGMAWQEVGDMYPVTLGKVTIPEVYIECLEGWGGVPTEYRAHPSGGFPPYTYKWEYARMANNVICPPVENGDKKQVVASPSPSCILQVTITDKCGYMAQNIVYPSKKREQTDVEDANADACISVYPNPTGGSFRIANVTSATVYLYNTTMSLVQTFEHVSESASLDCSHLPTGLYILKIVDDNGITAKKIILNR